MNTTQIEVIRNAARERWADSKVILNDLEQIINLAAKEEEAARRAFNATSEILNTLTESASLHDFKKRLKISAASETGYRHGASGKEAQPSRFSRSPEELKAYKAAYKDGEESIFEFDYLEDDE